MVASTNGAPISKGPHFLCPQPEYSSVIGPEEITQRQRSQFANSQEHHGQVFDPMIGI